VSTPFLSLMTSTPRILMCGACCSQGIEDSESRYVCVFGRRTNQSSTSFRFIFITFPLAIHSIFTHAFFPSEQTLLETDVKREGKAVVLRFRFRNKKFADTWNIQRTDCEQARD